MAEGIEGCSIPRLLSFIYVNIKSADKRYRIKRSTIPIEITNDKKLKQKEVDIRRKIRKYTNLMILIIFNKI